MKPELISELVQIHCRETRSNLTPEQKSVIIAIFEVELRNTYQTIEDRKS
jgi:hypothetical protein